MAEQATVFQQLRTFKIGGLSHSETAVAFMSSLGSFVTYAYLLDRLPQWFGVYTNLVVGTVSLFIAAFFRIQFLSPLLLGASAIFIVDGVVDVFAGRMVP